MPPVPDEFLSAVKGTYTGIEHRIQEIPYACTVDGVTVSGRFHYLTFRDGVASVEEFVEFIYWKIIPFCIPRKERLQKMQKLAETGDERYMHELTDKARNLFIRSKEKAREKARRVGRKAESTTGEPGELILFVLLEAVLGAPQIACKMYLKTSEGMPVHGSDSVHLARGDKAGAVRVIWGESKLYAQFSSALDEICTSILEFLSADEGRTGRERDIDILKDHMDVDDDGWREALLGYFDPYAAESSLREESFACFVGFDFSAYERLNDLPREQREAAFVESYRERIRTGCQLFCDKVKQSGLDHLRFDFFLIPFPSVDTLRAAFLRRLGAQT